MHAQEVMLRRLKREVMAQLPPKRRQVVRLPPPLKQHWPPDSRPQTASGLDEKPLFIAKKDTKNE
jgi:hypothetical protein